MSMTHIQPLPIVMTTEEVAELLRCSAATVERYAHNHELPAIRIGRERRFRGDDVADFIASRLIAHPGRRKRDSGHGNA